MELSKKFEIIFGGLVIAKNIPDFDYDDMITLQKIHRKAIKIHRLCENYCNGDITEESYDERLNRLQGQINRLCEEFNFNSRVEFQSDPRGAEVRLSYNKESGWEDVDGKDAFEDWYCFYPFNF